MWVTCVRIQQDNVRKSEQMENFCLKEKKKMKKKWKKKQQKNKVFWKYFRFLT